MYVYEREKKREKKERIPSRGCLALRQVNTNITTCASDVNTRRKGD